MPFVSRLFFDACRAGILAPRIEPNEVEGCNALLTAFAAKPLSWCAYALGTAFHETGGNMSPNVENLNYSVNGLLRTFGRHRISETDALKYGRADGRPADQRAIGNLIYGQEWGRKHLGNMQPEDGFTYRGRGMDHVTGRRNYTLVDDEMGLDGKLVANPDLLLDPQLAARCIASGMERGRYRGHKLADFLPSGNRLASLDQFAAARAIINPDTNGRLIGRHALQFQTALLGAGWGN
jgi:putative chitinase